MRERDRGGQRHAGGLRADDDVDAELAGEAGAPGSEILQQLRVGVRALEVEWVHGGPAVVPAAGADADEPGSGGKAAGERL
jgi:hypothetical protein